MSFWTDLLDGYRFGQRVVALLSRVFKSTASLFTSNQREKKFDFAGETQKLHELYDETKLAFENSSLGRVQPHLLAVEIVSSVADETGVPVTEGFLSPFYDVISEALRSEGFWFLPEREEFLSDDPVSRAEARIDLRKRKNLYENSDEKLEYLVGLLRKALIGLISGVQSDLLSNGYDEDLSIDITDLYKDLGTHLEYFILNFFDDELSSVGVFQQYMNAFHENIARASGIVDHQPRTHTNEFVFPSDSPFVGEQLIDTYLRGTAFQQLFEAQLPVQIPKRVRNEHTWIVAGSGHGKTQLLQQLICKDIDSGTGFMVIDSQGDLIRNILTLAEFGPDHERSLAEKLILVDPNDIDYPVALNLFSLNNYDESNLTAHQKETVFNATVEMYSFLFGSIFGAELTARQDIIFVYIATLMMEIPDANISTFMKLLQDGKEFSKYMERLPGAAGDFFRTQYFSSQFSSTKKQVLTRLWAIRSNTTLERLFSATENKVDLFEAITQGKIVLINTAKSLLREEGSAILGRFFIALLSQATLLRATQNPSDRDLFNVYIDEVQEYADDSLEALTTQARKYNVGVTVAHQFLSQIPDRIRSSLATNTSTKLIGSLSNRDSRALADELQCKPEKIQVLNKTRSHSEFLLHVRHLTDSGVRVSIPFGVLESRTTISPSRLEETLDINRAKIARIAKIEPSIDQSTDIAGSPTPNESELKLNPPTALSNLPADRIVERSEETPSTNIEPPETRPYIEKTKSGKGGPQHKHIQGIVRKIGQAHGFQAEIEHPLPDGKSVDVVLDNETHRIAIETSVTTSASHEIGNIIKCVNAGFDKVVVICKNGAQKRNLASLINDADELREAGNIVPLLAYQFETYISGLVPNSQIDAERIAGYKTRVNYVSISNEDAERKKVAIAKALLGFNAASHVNTDS
ncbi:MAG: hypothetical protein AAF465_10045 [Pseudomonadota bacterium]